MEIPRIPEINLAPVLEIGKIVVGRLFTPGGWDLSRLIYTDEMHSQTMEHMENVIKGTE